MKCCIFDVEIGIISMSYTVCIAMEIKYSATKENEVDLITLCRDCTLHARHSKLDKMRDIHVCT